MTQNVYDVTQWSIPGSPAITAASDIGAVINSIISDIKSRQTSQSSKPGAVIYIPPGDYDLLTRVTIDVSFLQINGSGHGFTSIAIRNSTADTSSWHELNPGGSHIRVKNTDGHPEAFLVARSGSPRLSSIEFRGFCLDGVSFSSENALYANGKYGIRSSSATDSVRVIGVGFMYLEHAITIQDADATSICRNFIVECTNCVELTGSGQASLVAGNHMGAGPAGFTVFAENHFGLLVRGNNMFPIGKSLVHLKNCSNSIVAANLLHSFFSGMITFEGASSRNHIVWNSFWREQSRIQGPTDDLFGLVQINGDDNAVVQNSFDAGLPAASVRPTGAMITGILVKSGTRNFIASNRFVSPSTVAVAVLDSSTTSTKVLDCGTPGQYTAYSPSTVTYRALP